MSFKNKGLVFAMEEAELDGVAGDVELAPEVATEVEAGAAEVAEDSGDIEDFSGAIDGAQSDTESLGDIQDVMAESVESGEGLSEDAAKISEIAIENICTRLGIRSNRVMPSLESFGSKNSRLTATKVAMEGVGDKIKEIWLAIKRAFASVWQKIKDFFAKFFQNTEKVKKYAETLKDKASGLKSAKIKENSIKNSSIANTFNVGGKANLASVESILGNHSNLTNAVLGVKDSLGIVAGLLESGLRDEAANLDGVGDAIEKIQKSLLIGGSAETKKDKKGESLIGKAGPFVGGEFYSFTLYRAKGDGNMDIEVSFSRDAPEKKADESVPTLKQAEAVKVCETVIALMNTTDTYKKSQAKIEAINKAYLKTVDAAIGLADTLAKSSDSNTKLTSKVNAIRKALTDMNGLSTRLIVLTPSMNVSAAKTALNYVAASLKQYETAKSDDKK